MLFNACETSTFCKLVSKIRDRIKDMETRMTPDQKTEEHMVFLVRNALLVAQQEMGDGDQWPVVKDTIHKIMKDWEDLKVERNVDEELRIHLYAKIKEMEEALPECAPEARAILEPRLRELRETCDAYFSDLDPKAVSCDGANELPHIKRMNAILGTLEEEEDNEQV